MLGRCSEAEDVGQEVFIRFYRSLDTFRHESGIGTYLTRIAINLSLNQIKKNRNHHIMHDTQLPDNLPGRNHTDEQMNVNRIFKAILELTPHYRSVVVLRLIQGYSTHETAEILRVPAGTVMSWLARAQKMLRIALEFGESI